MTRLDIVLDGALAVLNCSSVKGVIMSAALSLTPKEVAALAGTTEKAVRNEIASGAVTPLATPRGRAVRRSFDDRTVV